MACPGRPYHFKFLKAIFHKFYLSILEYPDSFSTVQIQQLKQRNNVWKVNNEDNKST